VAGGLIVGSGPLAPGYVNTNPTATSSAVAAIVSTTTSARAHSPTSGGDFICRHCGAQYLVRYTELPIADSGSVYCDVCRRQMIQWNSSREPSYKLVKRPNLKDQKPEGA
jgi:hypothetical protein